MEPTIYKPSIYKGAGIYKTGAAGGGGGDNSELIGGKWYRTTTINGKLWLAQNLDYIPEGITANPGGSPTYPAVFYNGDDYRKIYGSLYNWYAVNFFNNNKDSLFPGWHVATEADFNELIAFVGGGIEFENKMLDWSGSDEYGFSATPGGYYYGSFQGFDGDWGWLWTGTQSGTNYAYYLSFRHASFSGVITQGKWYGMNVRLVHD